MPVTPKRSSGRRAAPRRITLLQRTLQVLLLGGLAVSALSIFGSFVGLQPVGVEAGEIASTRDVSGKNDFLFVDAPLAVVPPVGSTPSPAVPASAAAEPRRKKKDENFWFGPIPSIEISFTPEEWEFLKRDNRRYCKATLVEGGKTYTDVAVKLKGSAGSFQGPDGKPGLTVSFDVFKGAERFHGLKKLHFNNGAQDATFLQELIAGEMARKAGVPASRCSHALVKWQGRDLGLYVTKEAFTKDFLALFYKNVNGDLYDGGFVREIDENTEQDQGDPKNKEALKELIAASRENDAAKRWERLSAILDVDLFASYCAMEAILCHWDGYGFNRNNYRFYRDPGTGKFSFFLHGMDQTFGDANFPLIRDFGAQVSNGFMRCPEGLRLYKERLDSIYTNVLKPIDWGARVTEVGQKVRTALEEKDPQQAKNYESRIVEARTRVTNRIAAVGKMLGDMPKPFKFTDNVAVLDKDWRPESGGAQLEEQTVEGKASLFIRANGGGNASWRRSVLLEPGKYQFEARVRTQGVVPVQGGSGEGAGLRISGGSRSGNNALKGDTGWQTVSFPFESSGAEVVLVAELRASKGEAWFEKGSLRLVRAK